MRRSFNRQNHGLGFRGFSVWSVLFGGLWRKGHRNLCLTRLDLLQPTPHTLSSPLNLEHGNPHSPLTDLPTTVTGRDWVCRVVSIERGWGLRHFVTFFFFSSPSSDIDIYIYISFKKKKFSLSLFVGGGTTPKDKYTGTRRTCLEGHTKFDSLHPRPT